MPGDNTEQAPWTEGGPPTDALQRSIDKNIELEEDNAYLRWELEGVKQGFFERWKKENPDG